MTTVQGGICREVSLPYSREWELYHNSFSLCSKKLRVCLAELALPYLAHHVDLIETGSYQNVSRQHLAIHPAGLVPVLVHNGHPVYESHDQIVYAAAHAGELGKKLLPEDPETRAIAMHWIDCASLVGPNPVRGTGERAGHCIPGLTLPIFATMVRYIPYREIAKGLLSHPNKERPIIFATLKFRGVARLPGLGPAMSLLRRSRRDMAGHLDALALQLEKHGGPWIAGDRFSLADVSWVVLLDRLMEADWDGYFWGGDERPTIAAYWNRLQQRESYQTQVEDQRAKITQTGMADVKSAKAANPALRAALEGG